MSDFSIKLKKILEAKDVSQYKLNKLTGISQSTISSILSGKQSPTYDTILKICESLEISMAEFDDNPLSNLHSLAMAESEIMPLDEDEKKALQVLKQMPLDEQKQLLWDKYKSLPAEHQQALTIFINLLLSGNQNK